MLDRKRLAQLCEMLRSDNDNERAVAARLATELVRRANTTWSDVILGAAPQAAPPRQSETPTKQPEPPKKPAEPPPYPFRRHPSRTPERNGVWARQLLPALLKKRSLDHWERRRLMNMQMEDLSVGLDDVQWRELIRLAIDFGLWPGSKANPRRRRQRQRTL